MGQEPHGGGECGGDAEEGEGGCGEGEGEDVGEAVDPEVDQGEEDGDGGGEQPDEEFGVGAGGCGEGGADEGGRGGYGGGAGAVGAAVRVGGVGGAVGPAEPAVERARDRVAVGALPLPGFLGVHGEAVGGTGQQEARPRAPQGTHDDQNQAHAGTISGYGGRGMGPWAH